MLPKHPYPVLLIGETFPAELRSVITYYPAIGKVHTAIHPYQVETILRKERIDLIFISIADWNRHFFTGITKCNRIPDLVLVQEQIDTIDNSRCVTSDLIVKAPFHGLQLRDILKAADRSSSNGANAGRYDCVWLMVDGRWLRVAIADIDVVERIDRNQLLVCTSNADWVINMSLREFKGLLPEDLFIQFGRLLIPAENRQLVKPGKGYPFRNGWILTGCDETWSEPIEEISFREE